MTVNVQPVMVFKVVTMCVIVRMLLMAMHAKQNASNAKQVTKVRWRCAFPHVPKWIVTVTVMRNVPTLTSVLDSVQRNVEEMDPTKRRVSCA